MKNILLTGAAGFIGYHTSLTLLNNGFNVVGIDNLNDYYDIKLKHYRLNMLKKNKNFSFNKIDIEHFKKLKLVFERNKFSAVINLAARAGVPFSKTNPFVYLNTNANGTLNILELMMDYQVKKLVLASSSSVYSGEIIPFKENLQANTPLSIYAASKKSAEMIAYSYHSIYKTDISVLRYFTVYGPAGRPDMSYFKFIKNIDNGIPIVIYGDGSQSRDFTYIEDIAEGTVLALKPIGYEIINLSGGRKPVVLNEMIRIIESMLEKKAKTRYKSFLDTDIKDTEASIAKAKKLLNWSPKTDIYRGLKATVQWYIENRNLINKLK